MNRFVQRKNDYENALKRLKEALVEDESEIVIDGVLHRYEFTFELAWKYERLFGIFGFRK